MDSESDDRDQDERANLADRYIDATRRLQAHSTAVRQINTEIEDISRALLHRFGGGKVILLRGLSAIVLNGRADPTGQRERPEVYENPIDLDLADAERQGDALIESMTDPDRPAQPLRDTLFASLVRASTGSSDDEAAQVVAELDRRRLRPSSAESLANLCKPILDQIRNRRLAGAILADDRAREILTSPLLTGDLDTVRED